MSGTKGMLHYRVATKQEAVRLVLEGHLTYANAAARLGICKAISIEACVRMYREEGEGSFHKPFGRPPKAQAAQREPDRLRMEKAPLKKFPTELREPRHALRNIRRSTTMRQNSK